MLGANADKSAAGAGVGAGVVGGTQEQLAAWPMLMHPYLQDYWNGMDVSLFEFGVAHIVVPKKYLLKA